jgi:hypothetical protein
MKSIDELILPENLGPILNSYVANLHGNELHSNFETISSYHKLRTNRHGCGPSTPEISSPGKA